MFTKAQIQKFTKGFYPSETGRSENAPTGRGEQVGNRKERRRELSSYGLHDNKGGITNIVGTNRYVSRMQTIYVKDKLGLFTGEIKKIQVWDLK